MNYRIFPLLVFFITTVSCVDKSKFKTCQQSSFCRRHREASHKQEWNYVAHSLVSRDNTLEFKIREQSSGVILLSTLSSLINGGIVRLTINELQSVKPRFDASKYILKENCCVMNNMTVLENEKGFKINVNDVNSVIVEAIPLKIDVYSNGKHVISVNQRSLFKFEHHRSKDDPHNDCTDDGCFHESFGAQTDSKPNGPMSVGVDVTFINCNDVFGIPEHSDRFLLKNTKGSTDPYRLYNVDIFEYETESPMALYGSVPMMVGHSADRTVGLLWLNPSETWIDIESSSSGSFLSNIMSNDNSVHKLTHWMSETGILDMFIMMGPKPLDVMSQNGQLTGTIELPPIYSIGYHQCRWNYWSQAEVNEVDVGADEHDIPMDAIWLDIEYTEGRSKKYFTWDPIRFADPKTMVANLTAKGRRLITIIDPHIKKDSSYKVYNEAIDNHYFIKDNSGADYEGFCWPGPSFWPDYLNPTVSQWWSDKHEYESFPGFDGIVDIWNDMNEPSVFNGPETTAPRDLKHFNDVEHREIHNMYGFLMTKATYNGLVKYRPNVRPFILTRSYFAGSQRHAAAWTGDNQCKWEHMKMTIPNCLSNSVTGITFIGADVPGFFFNPESEELVIRWYQTAAFQPFYRGHAHEETRRREPWLFTPPTKNMIREAIVLRYSYLPYLYTLFYENHITGAPPMRPLWMQFPYDVNSFPIDDSYLAGDALLVAPVVEKGANSRSVYFPGDDAVSWFDKNTHHIYKGGNKHTIDAPLNVLPHFQRSGSVITKRERIRRSALLTINDPISLEIFLDKSGAANGSLYLDDGQTLNYKNGDFIYGKFKFDNKVLSYETINWKYGTKSWIERITIYGWTFGKPNRVVTQIGDKSSNLQFKFDDVKRILVIRKPEMTFLQNWTIKIA